MTQSQLNLHQLIRKVDGSLVSDMDGEKVMLSIKSGKYFNLGRIGGRIWELMEGPMTASEIAHRLISEFDVTLELCEQHVLDFLQQLYAEQLIELVLDHAVASRAE